MKKNTKIILIVVGLLLLILVGFLVINKLSKKDNSKDDENSNYNIETITKNYNTSIFINTRYLDYSFNSNKLNVKDNKASLLDLEIDTFDAQIKSLIQIDGDYFALIKKVTDCEYNPECQTQTYLSVKFNGNGLIWSKEILVPKNLEWYDTHTGIEEIFYNFWNTQPDAEYNCYLVNTTFDGNQRFNLNLDSGEICMKMRPNDNGNTILSSKTDTIYLTNIDNSGKIINQIEIPKPLEKPTSNVFRPYLLDNNVFCAIESVANGEILLQHNIDTDEELTYDFSEILKEKERIGHVMHMYRISENKYVAFLKIDNGSSSTFEYAIIENNNVKSRTLIKEINLKDVFSIAKIKQLSDSIFDSTFLIEGQNTESSPGTSWKLTILN